MSAVVLQPPKVWRPGTGLLLPKWNPLRELIWLMAGSAGDVYEAKLLDALFSATALGAPATIYTGLWGAASSINDASTGGTAGEISGGSYARVGLTNNNTNFPAATGTSPTVKKNGVAITFATASANWNSGNPINQTAMLDGNTATSSDKILVWGDLTVAQAVLSGNTAQFAINDFQITCD